MRFRSGEKRVDAVGADRRRIDGLRAFVAGAPEIERVVPALRTDRQFFLQILQNAHGFSLSVKGRCSPRGAAAAGGEIVIKVYYYCSTESGIVNMNFGFFAGVVFYNLNFRL